MLGSSGISRLRTKSEEEQNFPQEFEEGESKNGRSSCYLTIYQKTDRYLFVPFEPCNVKCPSLVEGRYFAWSRDLQLVASRLFSRDPGDHFFKCKILSTLPILLSVMLNTFKRFGSLPTDLASAEFVG